MLPLQADLELCNDRSQIGENQLRIVLVLHTCRNEQQQQQSPLSDPSIPSASRFVVQRRRMPSKAAQGIELRFRSSYPFAAGEMRL